jgi:hypothetical protein
MLSKIRNADSCQGSIDTPSSCCPTPNASWTKATESFCQRVVSLSILAATVLSWGLIAVVAALASVVVGII